jgi:hypothetical protein
MRPSPGAKVVALLNGLFLGESGTSLGPILEERPWEVLQVTLKKHKKNSESFTLTNYGFLELLERSEQSGTNPPPNSGTQKASISSQKSLDFVMSSSL